MVVHRFMRERMKLQRYVTMCARGICAYVDLLLSWFYLRV